MKENKKYKIWIIRIILLILIFLWMNIIFGFSAQKSEESSGLSQMIVRWFTNNENLIPILEHIIRKLAHFSIYAVGGILIFGFCQTFSISLKRKIGYTIIVGALYAATDEFHQLFVGGRSGQVSDVLIDTSGVIFGIIFIIYIQKLIKIVKRGKKHD